MKDSAMKFGAKEEEVSPGKFLRIERTDRSSFSEAEIRPARLGGKDFGKIIIVKRDGGTFVKRDRSR